MNEDRREEALELAKSIEKFANAYGHDTKSFVQGCLNTHLTLQQGIARLFAAFFVALADFRYVDGRNKAAVELAKKLKPIIEDSYLPLV